MALPYLPCLALLCYIAVTINAYTTTDTSNTQLPPHAKFVSSPKSRGTLDILWSSLFTILASTWTVQHLNVPEQRNCCKQGWRGSLKWYTKKFFTGAKWIMITTIAPEVVIGMACYDLLAAKRIAQDLRKFALEDDVPWTLTHSYFANMGVFTIQSGVRKAWNTAAYISLDNTCFSSCSSVAPNDQSALKNGAVHCNQTNENPLPSRGAGGTNDIAYCHPYHLTGRQIYQLRKRRILMSLPHISETELADRSKSDSFIKVIAIFQILWATVQIVVRTIRRLAISQLELAVIAFAACAIFMYGLYWSKPKDVGATITIIQYEGPIPQDVLRLIKGRHTYMGYFLIGDDSMKWRHGSSIRNDATEYYHDGGATFWVVLAMMFGATLFGGIHVAAWNFDFPTSIELILWRSASVYSAACGPIILLMGLIFGSYEDVEKRLLVIFLVLVFLYITARLFLLVEIFRTLLFLPPLAYVRTWTADIPHFS